MSKKTQMLLIGYFWKGHVLGNKIYMTNTWMDTSYFSFPPSSLFFGSNYSRFQGLLHDIEQKLYVLTEHGKRSNVFSPSWEPCSGLVLFGGVFDPQQVSQACLPEEHRADIVGNLFNSWWRQWRLWRLWTGPDLQEIADPRDFLWKVVWKFFTRTRNKCETVLSF